MPTPTELHVAVLDREIADRKTDIARIKGKHRALSASVANLTVRHAYLRVAHWFRSPVTSLSYWPLFVFAVGPLVMGVLSLVAINEMLNSWPYAIRGFCVGTIVSAFIFAALLYWPSNVRLPTLIVDTGIDRSLEVSRLSALGDQLRTQEVQLQSTVEHKKQLITSDKQERKMLLQRNWRAMRGYEWEEYLVEVCRALGARVERIGGAGDQGVDLIVEFGARRIAVQAKGYENAINNKAVQEVYAGMAHHRCTACAVITNSRFRKSAFELADSTYCILIGEDEFPNFVLGRLSL